MCVCVLVCVFSRCISSIRMEGPSGVEEAALRSCGVLDEADLIKYGDRVILEWEEGKGSLLVTLKKGRWGAFVLSHSDAVSVSVDGWKVSA
mgnify:CR=1 FL=1